MPAVKLKIDSKDLASAISGVELLPALSEVEYATSLDMLDCMTARFTLAGADARKVAAKTFLPGAPFELGLGTLTWKGDVTRVHAEQPSSGPFQMIVYGLEPLARLRNTRVTKLETTTKDQIVKALLGPSGASVTAQAVGATAEDTVLIDESVLSLVKRWADERNFVIGFSGTAITFGPGNTPASGAALKLEWTQLRGISVTTDLEQVVTGVTVHGRDYKKGIEVEKYAAAGSAIKQISGGTKTAVSCRSTMAANELVLDRQLEAATQSEMKELATGELQRRAETFLRGRVTVREYLAAKPLQKVTLANAPWPFEGPFLVRGATWAYRAGGGPETTIEFFSDSYPPEA